MSRRARNGSLPRVALLAFAALVLGACGGEARDRAQRVTRGELLVTVEAAGSLRAVDSSAISAPNLPDVWDFKIAWMAPESSDARAGRPVLRLDPTELEQELERKKAERDGAAKELEKKDVDLRMQLHELELRIAEASASLRRAKLKVDVPSQQVGRIELAQARLEAELAEREVAALSGRRDFEERSGRAQILSLRQKSERAAQRVAELEAGIQSMTVLAPRDGLVLYRQDWRGNKKKVGDAVSKWDRLMEIPDLSRMEAEAEIDEADAGRVAVGQRVSVRLEAHPERVYPARVADIARLVQRQSQRSALKVYRIRLTLDETDTERMRPGMRLRADVEVERREDVLLVPLAAVVATAGGPGVERRRAGGRRERASVRLGARNAESAEVLEGLNEGDTVLLPGGAR
jgi:HlyD family secretion protein